MPNSLPLYRRFGFALMGTFPAADGNAYPTAILRLNAAGICFTEGQSPRPLGKDREQSPGLFFPILPGKTCSMDASSLLYRRAVASTLVLSAPLLVGVCVLLLGWRQGVSLAFSFPVQVIVAFAAMFVFGWWMAPRWGGRCAAHPVLAGLFAVGVFLVGVLSGSSTSMLLYGNFDLEAWLLRPLCWLGFIGCVPAFLVGLAGCYLTRRLLRTRPPA